MSIKLGLEMEGVFVKNGMPIRAARLFDKKVDFKDSYDVCAEVRTYNPIEARESSAMSQLGAQILREMHRVTKEARIMGGDVIWDEVLIPEHIHEDVIRNVAFGKRVIHNEITGVDGYAKSKVAGTDDRFRGGGLHINVSGIKKSQHKTLVKMLTQTLPHPTDSSQYLPFRSAYRARGLWRET